MKLLTFEKQYKVELLMQIATSAVLAVVIVSAIAVATLPYTPALLNYGGIA